MVVLLPPIIIPQNCSQALNMYSERSRVVSKCLFGLFCRTVASVSKMKFVLSSASYFCNIWGCMCLTDTFKFRWSGLYICKLSYYHHHIGSTNRSHDFHIFLGCLSEVVVSSYPVILFLYIEKETGYYRAVYAVCKYWVTLGPECRTRSLVYFTISLSQLWRFTLLANCVERPHQCVRLY